MKLNPYLHFNGNCKDAFDYYVKHLGAKVVMSMTYAEAPRTPRRVACSPRTKEKIMHARLDIGRQHPHGQRRPQAITTRSPHGISVSINLTDDKEAERIYAALSEKARGPHAAGRDVLGASLCHADRPIRHSLDDQLREGDIPR